MLQSFNSLNSAMMSFSAMKTINSVKNQLEGRSNILKSEIASGSGNTEAKEEKLAANQEKLEKVTQNLNKNLTELNENITKPMTAEEKEKLLEEKREAQKEAEKKAIQETKENSQKTSSPVTSDSVVLSQMGSMQASTPIKNESSMEIQTTASQQHSSSDNAPVIYNASSIVSSDVPSTGVTIDVTA